MNPFSESTQDYGGFKELNEVDLICDSFEESWKNGQRPDIGDYLNETQPDSLSTLLIELVKVDIAYREKLGESPALDEYQSRFPKYSRDLAALDKDRKTRVLEGILGKRRIGGFILQEQVGEGSFGTVWKAWDPHLERDVAIKLPNARPGRGDVASFAREARAAARLKHPGIVPVHGFNVDDGIGYIVYEFVDGLTLGDWARDNKPTVKESAEICRKLAAALEYAHRSGIIHRDLKPGNVIVDARNNPRITDFGLAKRTDTASTATVSGAVVGTLAYMSPEQAAGRAKDADRRADIYSLGVILYELLTGKRPFSGEEHDVKHQIQNVEPDSVRSHRPDIEADIETVCLKAIEKEPTDRYDNASGLHDDLQRFVDGEPVRARRMSIVSRIRRWLTRNPSKVVAIVAVAVAIAATVTANLPDHRRATSPPPPVPSFTEWKVRVRTDPPGAKVDIFRRDGITGQAVLFGRPDDVTPAHILLPPGDYYVKVWLSDDRCHEANRTVPPVNEHLPLHGTKNRGFIVISDGELEWPEILLPEADVTSTMVFVPGTDNFEIRPGLRVPVPAFWVSPREFTYDDFFNLRPDNSGLKPLDKPRFEQPRHHAMTETYDYAVHFAEEAGGRLLTELEFEYLARLAAAEIDTTQDTDDEEVFLTAGGNDADLVFSDRPIPLRGMLSGVAEWTFSRPNNPNGFTEVDFGGNTDLRVARGGSHDTALHGIPAGAADRNPSQRVAAHRSKRYDGIGFRIARSVHPRKLQELRNKYKK